MSPIQPDIVDVWIFRDRKLTDAVVTGGGDRSEAGSDLEILLLRRAPGRILPGLWQCVSGSIEPGETVSAGALRELQEETGIGAAQIDRFYGLDQVNQFHEPSFGGIVSAVDIRGARQDRGGAGHVARA